MTLLGTGELRTAGGRLRRGLSLAMSLTVHGSLFAWLVVGGESEPRTLYEQAIEPHREKIVWYNLRDRLPEVSEAKAAREDGPLKALAKARQTMVSRAPDGKKGEQMIWLPEPQLETAAPLDSPNVLAFPRPEERPVRAFEAPRRTEPEPRSPAALPVPPEVAAARLQAPPVAPAPARPIREFTPPERARRADAALPEAPETAASVSPPPSAFPSPARPQPRAFSPPAKATVVRPAPELPAAPEMAAQSRIPLPGALPGASRPTRDFLPAPRATRPFETLPDAPELRAAYASPSLGLPAPARPAPRAFTPPAAAGPRAGGPLPDAPELRAAYASPPSGLPAPARPAPRAFTPPAAGGPGAPAPLPAPPPAVASRNLPSAAIVGLNPSPSLDVPRPPGARTAEFSAGPVPRATGASPGAADGALVSVPGLTVRDGARDATPTLVARVLEPATSAQNLAAAARAAPPKTVATQPEDPARLAAVRVSSAPDPRMEGRIVYSIAVQMPNVTSFSGSWILWFAERERVPGAPPDIRPPLPLRKVDPKYVAAAVDERVEGRVRLAAVIRASGRVDTIALLQGLDARLDSSAQEALSKWEFEPALRNGRPVDVDAVVEIPFRLAPRNPK